ncbi:MAG: hypothetical protein AAB467_04710, partial [Patescibacteria group bacterium]
EIAAVVSLREDGIPGAVTAKQGKRSHPQKFNRFSSIYFTISHLPVSLFKKRTTVEQPIIYSSYIRE